MQTKFMMVNFQFAERSLLALLLVLSISCSTIFAQQQSAARGARTKDAKKVAAQTELARKRQSDSSPNSPIFWFVLEAANNEITVSFPAPPKEEPVDNNATGAFYTADFANMKFGLQLRDFRAIFDPAYYNKIPNYGDPEKDTRGLREKGWRVVYFRYLAANKTEMEAWAPAVFSGQYFHELDISILRNGWKYSLSCIAVVPNREIDRKICQEYFDSIRFVQNVEKGPRWYKFTSPDHDFTVSSPAMLLLRNTDNSNSSSKEILYQGVANDHVFMVSFFDKPIYPESVLFRQFEDDYEKTVVNNATKAGWQVVKTRRLAKNDFEFEMWMPSGMKANQFVHELQRTRVYRDHFYGMYCSRVSSNQAADRNLCHRFFNSFRLLEN